MAPAPPVKLFVELKPKNGFNAKRGLNITPNLYLNSTLYNYERLFKIIS